MRGAKIILSLLGVLVLGACNNSEKKAENKPSPPATTTGSATKPAVDPETPTTTLAPAPSKDTPLAPTPAKPAPH
jgi:hypothetical protein